MLSESKANPPPRDRPKKRHLRQRAKLIRELLLADPRSPNSPRRSGRSGAGSFPGVLPSERNHLPGVLRSMRHDEWGPKLSSFNSVRESSASEAWYLLIMRGEENGVWQRSSHRFTAIP
jgi:hypothetical protein